MKKKLIRELVTALVLAVVVYAIFAIGFATGAINSYWQGILMLVGINVTLAVSLNLATGYLGQLTLGHAGFMAVGAYVSALLSMYANLPFVLTLVIGAVAAGFIGLLIGVPILRLKGDYLCIITLAFNEIIRVIIVNLSITNGSKGLIGTPSDTTFLAVYLVAVITIFVVYSIVHSRHGRAIISIREDETAAELSGIDITYYKIKELVNERHMNRNIIKSIMECLRFKIIIFFSFSFFLFLFYWYLISAFCSVYENTQRIFLTDSISSFIIGLIYPFALYIFPAILRIISLKAKNLKILYSLSDKIPFF